jgi:hypothetical protein
MTIYLIFSALFAIVVAWLYIKNKKLFNLVGKYQAEVDYLYRRSNLVNSLLLSDEERKNLDSYYPDLKKINNERCKVFENTFKKQAPFKSV